MTEPIDPMPFPCCDHCGCGTTTGVWRERTGHDDTCFHGCNDDKAPPLIRMAEHHDRLADQVESMTQRTLHLVIADAARSFHNAETA
jgi:hypothetical protein